MSKEISRREFLENIGIGSAAGTSLLLLKDVAGAQPPANVIPSRTLGRTGAKVSILAFGCGSRFLMYKDEDSASAILNHAIDLGITYLDTAYLYGDGESETRVGKVMATRRKDVWLATKIPDRTRDEFLRRLEASLKRLQTDHVDLVHIHSLGQEEDLAKIEAPNGALKGLMEAREQKMARFAGMTSHTNGEVHGQSDRAPRPRLRADGPERLAQWTIRRARASCRQQEKSRHYSDEGDRAGVSCRRWHREGGHEFTVALFDEPASDDCRGWNAETRDARAQCRNRAQFLAADRSGERASASAAWDSS